MNRTEMIAAAYRQYAADRAEDITVWVGDIIEHSRPRNPEDPMEEVYAIQRIAQGLFDLANTKGANFREANWISAQTDPIGAIEQARAWALTVRSEFHRSMS